MYSSDVYAQKGIQRFHDHLFRINILLHFKHLLSETTTVESVCGLVPVFISKKCLFPKKMTKT